MKTSPTKVLLLESSGKLYNLIAEMLDVDGYQTVSVNNIEDAIRKISSHSVDVAISGNSFNELSGFSVFNQLSNHLCHHGIPFFLVLEKYEKEDMLIGLEIGIDNFIVHPLNRESILYKIETELRKRVELDMFETGNFKAYFNTSLTAMFYVEDNNIVSVNPAFHKLYNDCTAKLMALPVHHVFAITNNKQNELNYRRFQNGITNSCSLHGVQCMDKPEQLFDVSFYRGTSRGTTHVFAEIVILHDLLPKNSLSVNGGQTQLAKSANAATIKLTEREQQVFNLSARGLPIKIIADELALSERTVEKHRANIMDKANAKNMIEAIVSIRKGLLLSTYSQ